MNARRITLAAALTAVAMVLSYLESLIPPLTAIPGIKAGLANIAVMLSLYLLGGREACVISLLRVGLVSLLFGQAVGWFFGTLGAIFSLAVMLLLRHLGWSPVGVSVLGGVAHNVGQTVAAMLVLGTARVVYYLPVLVVSGVIAGVFVGLCAALLLARMSPKIGK